MRAHRSTCCFLYVKVARNLGLSAIWRKQGTWTSRKLLQSGQDPTPCYTVSVSEIECVNPNSATRNTQRNNNAVNTSVLGMVANGIDACDSFPCSTSLCGMLCKDEKNAVNTRVLGTVAKGMDTCDNTSCSTSFAQCAVQRRNNTINGSVLGHGRTCQILKARKKGPICAPATNYFASGYDLTYTTTNPYELFNVI